MQKRLRRIAPPDVVRSLRTDLRRDRAARDRAARDPEERVLRRGREDLRRDRAHRVPADRDLIPDGPSDKASSLYFSRRNCL